MNADDYFVYIPSSNLVPGLFVDLELAWTAHPFAFARFLIQSDKEIRTIQQVKRHKVKVFPARSLDSIDFSGLTRAAPSAPPEPAPEQDEALSKQLQSKREQEQRSQALRERRREISRSYREKSDQIKNLTESMKISPANAIHDMDELADELAVQFGNSENLLTRLVELTNKEYTDFHHTTNVTMMSLMLGSSLDLSADQLKLLARGAMMHDIGKVRLPPALRKKAQLSSAEQKLYQMHPSYGRQLLERVRETPPAVLDIIEHHHEYLDGSGYPHKLSGAQISTLVRIVSVVNHYDNLCNPTDPSQALTPKIALARLYRDFSKRLDTALVARLVELLGIYPPGTVVQLNEGRLGLVISSNAKNKMQPDILVYDPSIPKAEALIIRLSEFEDISIEKALRSGEYPAEIHDYFGVQDRIGYVIDNQVI